MSGSQLAEKSGFRTRPFLYTTEQRLEKLDLRNSKNVLQRWKYLKRSLGQGERTPSSE